MFPLCSALWEKLGNWCPRWNADVETVREERNGRILHVGLGLETLTIPGVVLHATVRSLSLVVTHSSVTSPSICEFGIVDLHSGVNLFLYRFQMPYGLCCTSGAAQVISSSPQVGSSLFFLGHSVGA